ncbi:SAV_2336 N-terminal domain-related protein [Aphanizomenon sp. CS-733/32]|uniref:SAV_2336 N-terminal domain-related protein n=1 Tax=Aphanizomenon sp. CS-733/32 TaxID=3021715 RepID=UPI002330F39E|nr:SAV_2336 N-terminal domain-related protein [Aphanizomenon sp. CS-733/32]MDB9308340.1 SAV_2336 N-terminal domain-related protein [Aphanizomenon sp. CS-733/32]
MSAEEIADTLWLANQIKLPSAITSVDEVTQPNQSSQTEISKLPQQESSQELDFSDNSTVEKTQEPVAKAYKEDDIGSNLSSDSTAKSTSEKSKPASPGVPFKSPAVTALPNALEIGRSLRPLMRKVPSRIKFVLDEENTAQQIAENDVWIPVLKPARERWLDLVIVVEENRATVVWEETINEFRKLMERHGAFRNVYTWSLRTSSDSKPQFFHQQRKATKKQRSRSDKELLEPNSRRLILLISDCISSLWWEGKIHKTLELWSKQVLVTVLQLLPEQLWERTVLDLGISVSLSAIEPGLLNSKLTVHDFPMWLEQKPTKALCTGQKIEKKLAKETEKGFHRKLPHNQRNPYEPD